MRSFTALLTALLLISQLRAEAAAPKAVTIEDVLAYQRPASITPIWSPDGKTFLYESTGKLVRCDAATGKTHDWLSLETLESAATPPERPKEFGWQNRRVASNSYQWFPDSKSVLASVRGDLFVIRGDGKWDQVTHTSIEEGDPKLSPDGKQVLYRSNANLFLLNLSSRDLKQLTANGTPTLLNGQLDWVYPEELDLGTATWWSPDSQRIAYLQFDVSREFVYPQSDLVGERALSEPERYPQAGTPNARVRLGQISAAGGETRWMDLGDTANALFARVQWLPDSSALAVERLSRVQDTLDLLLCDPASGAVHPILHEQSKTWINMADNLFFLKGRREFLWTSESTGFRHLYRYSDSGELLAALTSGDWGVSVVTGIDEANERVYYTSSEASPLESQLSSVSFAGGSRTRITPEAGDHQIQSNPDGSYFLDTWSSLRQPPSTVLRKSSGAQVAMLIAPDKEIEREFDILPGEIVPVKARDGVTLYARLTRPAGFRAAVKYPVIVDVYGGPGVQVVRNRWAGLGLEQVMAHRGYVVWQLDNRGSNGRGHAFEAPVYRQLGTQEVEDQRAGVEHLVSLGFVDPARIGITGWSYGGYMTIRSLLLAPDVFKVGVAGAPVTDWHNYDTIYTERYMGLPQENAAAYDASSNVKNAARLQGRLLILHNMEDDNVLFQNTMQMAGALEAADKPFFMRIYPQKTHGVTGALRKSLYEAMLDFFDANLKPDRSPR